MGLWGNSNMRAQNFSSVRLPAQDLTCSVWLVEPVGSITVSVSVKQLYYMCSCLTLAGHPFSRHFRFPQHTSTHRERTYILVVAFLSFLHSLINVFTVLCWTPADF
jgi:hypothetical protein